LARFISTPRGRTVLVGDAETACAELEQIPPESGERWEFAVLCAAVRCGAAARLQRAREDKVEGEINGLKEALKRRGYGPEEALWALDLLRREVRQPPPPPPRPGQMDWALLLTRPLSGAAAAAGAVLALGREMGWGVVQSQVWRPLWEGGGLAQRLFSVFAGAAGCVLAAFLAGLIVGGVIRQRPARSAWLPYASLGLRLLGAWAGACLGGWVGTLASREWLWPSFQPFGVFVGAALGAAYRGSGGIVEAPIFLVGAVLGAVVGGVGTAQTIRRGLHDPADHPEDRWLRRPRHAPRAAGPLPLGAGARPRPKALGVAFSADGSLAASGHASGAVRLWRVTGAELKALVRFKAGDGPINAVAFSGGDAGVAAAGHDGALRVWRAADGALLWERWSPLYGFAGPLLYEKDKPRPAFTCVACRGRYVLAGDWRGDVHLFALDGGAEVRLWSAHRSGGVSGVAFLPDGRGVSAGGDGTVRVWRMPP
jgi:hypothetical protein